MDIFWPEKSLAYEIREDEYGVELLCLTDDGSETCYRRENN
jgi:hypothetical protein